MSLKPKLRAVVVCLVLQAGLLVHVPMRPEQIEELMQQMNRPKLAHVLPSEQDDADGDPPD